jgi:ATP-dependent Clp protease ATP-binding subunit ClpB
MLRISGTRIFTKNLVKPPIQNGLRLGLIDSTLRASHYVRWQSPPMFVRNYAQQPGGGFPGFSLPPQHQKGEALKEYVSHSYCALCIRTSTACEFRVLI